MLKKASELRVEGKIPVFERLGQHIAPLAESTARTMLTKAFRPFMKNSTRVDLSSFARVISRFTYPGSPPPRREVVKFLYDLCCDEGHEKADPDLLVDMLFDKGGVHINRFGLPRMCLLLRTLDVLLLGRVRSSRKTATRRRLSPLCPTASSPPSLPLPLPHPQTSIHALSIDLLMRPKWM